MDDDTSNKNIPKIRSVTAISKDVVEQNDLALKQHDIVGQPYGYSMK